MCFFPGLPILSFACRGSCCERFGVNSGGIGRTAYRPNHFNKYQAVCMTTEGDDDVVGVVRVKRGNEIGLSECA